MEPIVYIILAILGGFAAIVGLIEYSERKRSKELENEAYSLGFSFEKKPESQAPPCETPLFKWGFSKKISNFAKGSRNGKELCFFDYSYFISAGKSNSTHRQTIFALPNLGGMPKFSMRQETIFDKIFYKIGDKLGYKDIDFGDDREFSDGYKLKGDDEAKVRELFSPELRRLILEKERRICLESDGNSLVYYINFRRVPPSKLEEELEFVSRLLGMIEK
ncbi:MAG: hypothetical protein ACP5E4_03045 [Candidatus Aenigmatarchaeota archaeon]